MLLLIACPAAQLGVELPPGGADAISHEDLRRDVRRLTNEAPDVVFVERMGQMQFAATGQDQGAWCVARVGKAAGESVTLVAAWPGNAGEATAAAALISIAKAWDLDGGPPGPRTLCLLEAGGAVPDGASLVGPLAPTDLPPERLVYTDLQAQVRALFVALPNPTRPAPRPRSP